MFGRELVRPTPPPSGNEEREPDVHAPGFYLHLDNGGSFMGAGVWHPDGKTLTGIRDLIVAEPARWKRILAGKTFKATFEMEGESLKRPPRGYDPEHPLIEDLKRIYYYAKRAARVGVPEERPAEPSE